MKIRRLQEPFGAVSDPCARGPVPGIDPVDDVARAYPYDANAFLNIHQAGWEMRLGARGAAEARRQ